MKNTLYQSLLSCLFIHVITNCAASSSQEDISTPTSYTGASLQELALKALIAHPAQLAIDLPALHNENNPFYDQRYTLPAKSISDALLARIDGKQLEIKKEPLTGLAMSPDGRTIATWQRSDKTLNLSDLQTGNLLRTLSHENENVYSAAFSPTGTFLTTGLVKKNNLFTGTARLWDPHTGELLRMFPSDEHPTTYISATAFNADGSLIALASTDNSNTIVSLWDPATGAAIRTFSHPGTVGALAFSPDNTLLAVESTNGNVELWNTITGEPVRLLHGDAGTFLSLAFSSDGTKLSAVSSYGAIKVWDIPTGILEFNLERVPNYRGVIISPDEHQAASMQGNTISVWNTKTRELLHTMHDHTDLVISLAFSPDGKILASGSYDQTVRLWNTKTGALIRTLHNNDMINDKLVFTPDGSTLIANTDHSLEGLKSYVHVWRLDYQKDLQTIRDIDEQQLLLHAAQDWLAGNVHVIPEDRNAIYHHLITRLPLITRFPYLNDDRLFTAPETLLEKYRNILLSEPNAKRKRLQ